MLIVLPDLSLNATDIDGNVIRCDYVQLGSDMYALFTIDGTIFWFRPDLDNAVVQALTGDAALTMTYAINISDGTAKVSSGSITFTITAPST